MLCLKLLVKLCMYIWLYLQILASTGLAAVSVTIIMSLRSACVVKHEYIYNANLSG